MMKKKTCSAAAEKLLGSIFNTGRDDSTLLELPASSDLTESEIRSIYKHAEELLTQGGPKLIALHGPFLIWFDADDGRGNPQAKTQCLQMANSDLPKIKAVVNIRGFFVENHSSGQNIDGLKPPGLKPTHSTLRPAAVRLRTEGKTETFQNILGLDRVETREFKKESHQHYLYMRKNIGDRYGETIFFDIWSIS